MSNSDSLQFDSYLAPFLDDDESSAQGIRVVEPTPADSQAQRGSLYTLVELMGESPVRDQSLDDVQSILQQTYYSAGGSVSAILEQAILAAHASLAALNRRSPATDLRAGILCVAVVQNHLVMASAGPGLALLATIDRLDQFPPDPSHFTNPIGGNNLPQVTVYRHQLSDGDVLFLGESDWILVTNVKTLGGAVANTSRVNRFDVVEYLRQQSNQARIPGLFIVFHAKHQPASPSPASFPSGLPTSVSAPPPVHSLPPAGDAPPPMRSSAQAVARTPAPNQPDPVVAQPVPQAQSAGISDLPIKRISPKAIGQQISDGLASTTRWTKDFVGKILPDRGATAQPRAADGWVGSAPEPVLESRPPAPAYQPPPPTQGSRARLFILLAVLIPVLAFATVGILKLREGAVSQAEGLKLVDQAEAQLAKAEQALNLNDKAAARSALNDAQRYLNEATNLIGLNERSRELSQRIGTELQKLMNVRSLYSLDFPLAEFPADASPHRVVVFDQDVYVLDIGRQLIEHFRTDPSRVFVEERSGPVLQEGDVVEGVTVGRLVDITWQPRIPGFADKASLLILDRNNNVFRYNRVDEATVLRLADAGQLQSISQLETYNGRLYLVDEQRNQILRYAPAGLGYDEPPDGWFDPQIQANLAGTVAMGIDTDIWLLQENNTLLRYSGGRQLPFSLDNSAGLTGRLADMALSSAPEGRVYLADGSQDRILVFDKLGNYIEQLQAAESDALRGLRGLYLDEVSGTLFILTQTSLYGQPLPD
ncbi:MAG: hypothetical protein DWI57_09990 [Chloroflexi bacterium]|nr:MAG: hypothetical protein DWI57_09990 [Chloroflexota bacterium]